MSDFNQSGNDQGQSGTESDANANGGGDAGAIEEITNIRAKQEALKAAKRTQAEENVRKARDLEAREAERVASGDGAGPV